MSETKFTPGKWFVSNRYVYKEMPKGYTHNIIAEVARSNTDEGKQNARLIAAAPALLESAEEVVKEHCTQYDAYRKDCDKCSFVKGCCPVSKLKAAVEKAKGGGV